MFRLGSVTPYITRLTSQRICYRYTCAGDMLQIWYTVTATGADVSSIYLESFSFSLLCNIEYTHTVLPNFHIVTEFVAWIVSVLVWLEIAVRLMAFCRMRTHAFTLIWPYIYGLVALLDNTHYQASLSSLLWTEFVAIWGGSCVDYGTERREGGLKTRDIYRDSSPGYRELVSGL